MGAVVEGGCVTTVWAFSGGVVAAGEGGLGGLVGCERRGVAGQVANGELLRTVGRPEQAPLTVVTELVVAPARLGTAKVVRCPLLLRVTGA